jgi:hypothetical protein
MKEASMNEYELSYNVVTRQGCGTGTVTERVRAGSEQNARDLVRARFGGQDVRISSSRMTEFGGGKDDRKGR